MPEDVGSSVHAVRSDPAPSRDRGNGPLIVVGIVAVIALGLAGWGLLRPLSTDSSTSAAPTYTDAQRTVARQQICAAFTTVRKGVSENTNLQPPGGEGDLAGALAVAANARLSLYDGGQYLLARVDPATPPELTDAIRTFANDLMDIGAAATAGAQNTDPDQAARLRETETAHTAIAGLCQ